MEVYLGDESDILDVDFRKRIIAEIEGQENVDRKLEAKKRYDILKDNVKPYVRNLLSKELKSETIREMEARMPNISVGKKIIEKKSQVYSSGAKRIVTLNGEEYAEGQAQLDKLVDLVNFNSLMKKVNKILEMQKNVPVNIKPVTNAATGRMRLKLEALHPHLYDVIPDSDDAETPRVFIFSYFDQQQATKSAPEGENLGGIRHGGSGSSFKSGDGINQVIADSPEDRSKPEKHYIWHTNLFYFTTNNKGEVIANRSPENLENTIGELTFVNFALDQDGSFWAQGGDDLVEASVQVNLLLADLYFIAKVQGMGLFYMFGTDVPEEVQWGPNNAIVGKLQEGDATPTIGFASSNPPLDQHMRMIEQYIALILSTNNLEPGTIQGTLSAVSAASGIQEMIRNSELADDIEDQKELFRDNEPEILRKLIRWHNELFDRGVLDDKFAEIGRINEDIEISLKFMATKQFLTEKDKLEIIEKRKKLGLDSEVDAIMRDNPELAKEQAEEKLKNILEEKLRLSREKIRNMSFNQENNDADKQVEGDVQA